MPYGVRGHTVHPHILGFLLSFNFPGNPTQPSSHTALCWVTERLPIPNNPNNNAEDMALRALAPSETNENSHARRRAGPAVHDRFIPRRGHDTSSFHMGDESCTLNASPAKEEYKRLLAAQLCGSPVRPRVLAFGSSPTSPEPELSIYRHGTRHLPSHQGRYIPQCPERILDAPNLVDDYYLNLLDWSENNIVGVALSDSVYLWCATTGSVQQLMQTAGTTVSSIAWAPGGASVMAVGTSDNQVQIWDTTKCRLIRCMPGHCARVGVLSWNGGSVLSSGSRDASIMHHDMRAPQVAVGRLEGTRTRCAA